MFLFKLFSSFSGKQDQKEDVEAFVQPKTPVSASTNDKRTQIDSPVSPLPPVASQKEKQVQEDSNSSHSAGETKSDSGEPKQTTTTASSIEDVKLAIPDKTPKIDRLSLAQLFEMYKTKDEPSDEPPGEKLGMNGIMQLVTDIGFNPEDIETLVLFYKLGCKIPLIITQEEFMSLQSTYSLKDTRGIKNQVTTWCAQILNNYSEFKKFYSFVFQYNKEPGASRIMVKEVAIPTWKLVFSSTSVAKYKNLPNWLDFIENTFKQHISRDIWMQFLEFVKEIGDDLQKYNPEQAWPVVIDEYVTFLKSK